MAPRVLGVAAGGLIVITNLRTILLVAGLKDAPLLAVLGALLAGWLVLVAWTVRKERAARRDEAAASRAAEADAVAVA
jgi:threonine/homoserine/homoserine lactone efflux protein